MAGLDFLMPQGVQRVLRPLLLHPHLSYSLSDLIRVAGNGRGGTQKVIERLRDAGVVKDRRSGNQRLFTIDTTHPLFPELRSMAVKTFGVADRLRDVLEPVREQIRLAFVFGSIANGTAGGGSDVDLLIVGDLDLLEISALLMPAERDVGRPVHLTLVDAEEWEEWKRSPVGEAIVAQPRIAVLGHEP